MARHSPAATIITDMYATDFFINAYITPANLENNSLNSCVFSMRGDFVSVRNGSGSPFRPLRAKLEKRRIGVGRKWLNKNFNTFRNCMKMRMLAFENRGRKCCEFL